eukprot:9487520-Pyramimonas_sp.AAC.1
MAAYEVQNSDLILNDKPSMIGPQQNAGKQVVLPTFVGTGARRPAVATTSRSRRGASLLRAAGVAWGVSGIIADILDGATWFSEVKC